jgi:tRNA pseudouridine32 synthase/23S rRNA pseudouridine746 synthase
MAQLSSAEIQARVLHRDKLLLVLNKPAGLAVHKGPKTEESLEQLLPHLQFGYKELPQLGHRLDRDTSGCLVLGRNKRALRKLGELFANNKVGKTYWAIVEGKPPSDSGTIDMPLLKVTGRQGWRIVPDPTGQPARTDYKVRGSDGKRSWLELTPHTGRTHQIRIHCAELGFPVAGDPIYGPSRNPPEPLMLHARAVSVPIEDGKPAVAIVAPPPDHMNVALKSMGWTGTV